MMETSATPPSTLGIVLAALFGAPITAFAIGSGLVAYLPGARDAALALGAHVIVPLWVVLACTLPLARTAKRACAICAGLTLPIAAALLVRAVS